MHPDPKPAACTWGHEWFDIAQRGTVEPFGVDALTRQRAARRAQAIGLVICDCNLEGAITCVLNGHPARIHDTCDEIVVQVEAAPAKLAQGSGFVTFDERGEYAGGGL
jgi:hypothetical protein